MASAFVPTRPRHLPTHASLESSALSTWGHDMNAKSKNLGHQGAWQAQDNAAESPEDVLLAWLLWLPSGADPAEAAIEELRRPELRHPTDPRLTRLAALFRSVSGTRSIQ